MTTVQEIKYLYLVKNLCLSSKPFGSKFQAFWVFIDFHIDKTITNLVYFVLKCKFHDYNKKNIVNKKKKAFKF